MKTRILFITLTIFLTAYDMFGQNRIAGIGDRVRITTPAGVNGRLAGRVIALSDSVLTVESEDAVLQVPLSAIVRLDISAGKKSGIKEALLWAAGTGVVTYFISYYSLEERKEVNHPPCPYVVCVYDNPNPLITRDAAPLIASLVALIAGGTAFGIARGQDRWQQVPVRFSPGVSAVPKGDKGTAIYPSLRLRLSLNRKR